MASLIARHSRGCEGFQGRSVAVSPHLSDALPKGCTCRRLGYSIRWRYNGKSNYIAAGSDREKATRQLERIETKLGAGARPRLRQGKRPKRDLYFAQSMMSRSLVKIGVTANLDERMKDLLAEPLHVIRGGERLERKMHERFEHLRFMGEWFHYEAELVVYLRSVGAI